jgi:ParB-like partition proteins
MKYPFSRIFGNTDKEAGNVVSVDNPVPEENDQEKEEIVQIPVSRIIPNRFQPRTMFDDEKLEELADTIRTHGMIQPIVVRTYTGGKFEIIAGERRYRAVKKLGWDTIPAIIRHTDDKQTASLALIENLQREQLSPIEEAIAYEKLIEIHGLTQEALAQRLGKGQSTIANKLRLLKLPDEVQDALLGKFITERHARALIPLKDKEKQLQVLDEILKKNLNVKQTEERVEKLLSQSEPKKNPNEFL